MTTEEPTCDYCRRIEAVSLVVPDYDQWKAWSCFEGYASGDFNVVADYNYGTLSGFYHSSLEFITSQKRMKLYQKALLEEFGKKEVANENGG